MNTRSKLLNGNTGNIFFTLTLVLFLVLLGRPVSLYAQFEFVNFKSGSLMPSVQENAGSVTLIVVRASSGLLPVTTVTYQTERFGTNQAISPDDYNGTSNDNGSLSGVLDFPFTSSSNQEMAFTIPIVFDGISEPNETFRVRLTGTTSGLLGLNATSIVTINNVDPSASLSIDNVTAVEGNAGSTAFNFTVTLSDNLQSSFSVDFATADGTATLADNDYVKTNGTLNFSGNAGETQNITVNVNGDLNAETDETFFVSLSNPSNNNVFFANSTGQGTIINEDFNQAPTANAGTDQNVCTSTSAANITLSGSASSDPDSNPLTYTWKEGATTLATGVNPTVSLNLGTHMIDLTVDDGNGGTDTDQVVVAVRAAPVVTVADASTCAGGSATITANVSSGTAPFSYTWTVPGGASNPGNVASFSATVAGNYTVVVTDVYGCTGSDNGDLTVTPNPTVTVADASTCVGGNATITANVSGGTEPFSYAWTVPGGATNPGNVASFSATVAGNYAVVVTDVHGCTGSGNGDLTVNPNPTADAGADATIFTGGSSTIGGSPTASGGTGALTIAWTPTDGLSDASAANPTAEPGQPQLIPLP